LGDEVKENLLIAPDHGLIEPISVPEAGRIPDVITGIATSAEYDSYFRLNRGAVDLVAWTRTCLTVNRELKDDLSRASLGDDDKVDLLAGLVAVQEMTLAHWLEAVEPEASAR
jgi:hypothetical protein